jgi:predicted nucleic acid-binding protein
VSRILDSSAIFRSMKDRATDAIAGGCTLELARYELGNIVWKQHTLFKTIDGEESLRLIRVVADILNTLEILHVKGVEDRVLELAEEHSVTFYDASYLFHTRELGLPLVSEDKELIEKARKMGVKASTLPEAT